MADDVGARLAELDFAGVTPQEFARIVKGLSGKEISELARGELRERVLGEVFGRMDRQFRPENAGSLRATIRWRITGEKEAVYETTIADGTCTVSEGRGKTEPRLTLVMGDPAFLKLVSGNGNPVTMFLTRKIKATGDLGLASSLNRYFDIPRP
ncbi:SCP2 sterol-binding domain-containing protein [Streptomyces sp. MST-110588]|uniref:SCP2 sterol-binding domain-containing protein n=1 Tax=Streptomyces sp. MST-110588 TaxID=2833628 RepID=UPI001F5C672E|nr:SCP2 sterol-binding domain-containing protein [Streptomyces sp. MST-110588]UNO43033.1 SCP2 sterol-binding domain-containing protein [Streptomyces sp. MST-110588]